MMRFFRQIPQVLLATLFLTSCTKTQPLEPVEILKHSILRNTAIESASFSASISIMTKGYATLSGSAVAHGVIRGTGGFAADITFQGRDTVGTGAFESGKIRVVTLDGSQIFFKPENVQGPIVESFVQNLTGSLNGWWQAGSPLLRTGGRSTLSPAELHQISTLFLIHSSVGPEKFLSKRKAYRLEVSVSPDGVRTLFRDLAKENTMLTGTLWIDAKNFTLHRALWNLHDVLTPFGHVDLLIDVTLSDINAAPDIVLPTGSSGVLSLNSVFATISQ